MKHLIQFCFVISIIYKSAAVKDRYFPRYHLAPPKGWMNDPNGFCIYNNEYHLFYQYNPNSSTSAGIAHWGHAKSKDLFHWEHLPIALYPDKSYDSTGVFSGSAIVENEKMYLFYTGNVNHANKTPDHEQHQALATSSDGVKFTKYNKNPIIVGDEFQPNFRDPKVWKDNDTYYMVLGNSFNDDTLGRVLLFTSKDKISWQQASVLAQSDGSLGYMWECPDFFQLDDYFVLLFSPQGIKPQGDNYKNLYQCGYIVGKFDYNTCEFNAVTMFKELDHGHDFYATQTIEDDQGRRLLVAWLDMWEENYPEGADGFTGQMSLPRNLILTSDLSIVQLPVEEIDNAKGNQLRSGAGSKGASVTLEDKAGEIKIEASLNNDLELIIESSNVTVRISYDSHSKNITLDRGGTDGIRRSTWQPLLDILSWLIYVDASSIELFCGIGEITFSSRFFPADDVRVYLGEKTEVNDFTVTSLKRTVYVSDQLINVPF